MGVSPISGGVASSGVIPVSGEAASGVAPDPTKVLCSVVASGVAISGMVTCVAISGVAPTSGVAASDKDSACMVISEAFRCGPNRIQ